MSVTALPKGTAWERGKRESTDAANHVDGRSSTSRAWAPLTVTCAAARSTAVRLPTRPSLLGVICKSCTGGASFRSLAAEAPLTSIGPQSWSGERLSYGSATETR